MINDVYLTLRAINNGSHRARDLTVEKFENCRRALWRKAFVVRSVADGSYRINERGEKLLKTLEGQVNQ